MGDALEKVVERWAGRRSFLGNLARGAVGLTIALAGFRGFEGKVHASGCDLCEGIDLRVLRQLRRGWGDLQLGLERP